MMGDANIPLCNTAMLLYVWGGGGALGDGKVCNISPCQLSSKLVLICPLTKRLCIVCWVLPSNTSVPNSEHHTSTGVCIWARALLLLLYNPDPLDGKAFVSSCMFGASNGFSPSVLWIMGFCGGAVLWLRQLDSPLSRLQGWQGKKLWKVMH